MARKIAYSEGKGLEIRKLGFLMSLSTSLKIWVLKQNVHNLESQNNWIIGFYSACTTGAHACEMIM